MKKNLLFAAMIALGLVSNAQNETFNETFPDGWIVNRELKLSKYDNPDKGGALDTGMVTPPIVFSTPSAGNHLITTAPAFYSTTASVINVSYDAYAFAGSTRDFSGKADQNMKCVTQLKAYLVRASFTAEAVPAGADVLGESSWATIAKGNNQLNINVSGTLVAGEEYRVVVVGRTPNECNGNGNQQAYVVDNIAISEAAFNETFSGNSLPIGWALAQGLSLVDYNTPQPGCANNRGVGTIPIVFNTTNRLMTSSGMAFGGSATSSVKVRFDLFAFNANANFACAAAQNKINCDTRVKIYIVDAANTSTGTVPSGTIYGESEMVLMTTGLNEINIPVTTPLTDGANYKLYVVGTTDGCSNTNAQRYVFDNIGIYNVIEEEDFSEVFPEGWHLNRELKLAKYCAPGNENEIGLVTPVITGNVASNHLMSSPASQYDPSTGSFQVSFNVFAFNGNTRGFACNERQNALQCSTSVKIYVVAGNYSGTNVPTSAQILGQSDWVALKANDLNVLSVPVNITFDINQTYRLLVFGRTENCNNGTQAYAIDNIRILEVERAILPVTFTHFTAKRNKSKVELSWGTAMEENNRGFHVQRNIDGSWKNIGFVFSQANGGNSSEALSYSFNDVNNSRGITQYRLLQVDHDNKGRYSEVRSVRAEEQLSKIMVYPNPSNTGSVNVMFEDASALRDVYVTDVAGRVVKQYRNVNTNLLTIENLADGYYTIQITNRATAATTVEKVIIKKR